MPRQAPVCADHGYLTEKEIERLQEAARKRSRYGHRGATMILVAYRHGLRASEVCGMRWDQIELNSGRSNNACFIVRDNNGQACYSIIVGVVA